MRRWLILASQSTREVLVYAKDHTSAVDKATAPGEPLAYAKGWPEVIGYAFEEAKAKRDITGMAPALCLFVVAAGEWKDGKLVGDTLPASTFEGRRAPGA